MKKRTKWKRVYNPVIGVRFFDNGKYTLGFFTIEKLWICKEYSKCAEACKEYSKCAEAMDGSHWFDKKMMQIRTDTGLVYKMPFFPWMEVYDISGKKSLADYYNEDCCMYKKKL